MKFLTLSIMVLVTACSTSPLKLGEEAQSLYSKDDGHICAGIKKDSNSRKDAAYCLGWIYVRETDKVLPAVDQLPFRDIPSGDPTTPYIWVTTSSGLMSPESPTRFGANQTMSSSAWKDSVKRLAQAIERWKTENPQLR